MEDNLKPWELSNKEIQLILLKAIKQPGKQLIFGYYEPQFKAVADAAVERVLKYFEIPVDDCYVSARRTLFCPQCGQEIRLLSDGSVDLNNHTDQCDHVFVRDNLSDRHCVRCGLKQVKSMTQIWETDKGG